jgi:diguanylate cyclase (GGDEF)-like protein
VLTVEAVTAAVTIVMVSRSHVELANLVILVVLIVLGLGKEELTRQVERTRRRFSDTPHQNMTSVWTFAAALLLPPGLAVVVVAALYAYLWLRIWYPLHGVRAWKVVFSASAVTLSCHTATAVMHAFGVAPMADRRTVVLATVAIVLYSAVNLGLVAGAIALMTPDRTMRRLFGTPADAALEYATLTLGAAAAMLLHFAPASVLLLIPALVVLHRTVLVRQLEQAASSDPKTGVLNPTTWQSLAHSELERARREQSSIGLLMLDIDHFKMVNDGNGHLAGDQVLVAVAEQLKQRTRPYDLLGRFGGDEFTLLCIGVDAENLIGIAERIRHSIETLTIPGEDTPVTMSIGAAHFPEVGPELEDLLLAADNALFAAKDRGRNRVVMLRHRQAARDQISSADTSN